MLSEQDKSRIKAAVEVAERGTAGELVVVLAPSSSDYAFLRMVGALGLTVVLAWEALLALPPETHAVVVSAQVIAFFCFYWLLGRPALLRLIVRRPLRRQMVMQRAARAFLEEGVTETRDRSGVLIFLSLAERQVVILADKGINERVAPTQWQGDVDQIVRAIKAGRAADGVTAAVGSIGELLAASFPPRVDDTNELSNAVREVR